MDAKSDKGLFLRWLFKPTGEIRNEYGIVNRKILTKLLLPPAD
jgi:hypothetical protein